MIEQRSIKGEWWIPDNSSNSSGGILSYTVEEGLELELFRQFSDSESPKFPVLHGRSTDGNPITLRNSYLSSYQVSYNESGRGDGSLTLNVQQALIGKHFDEEQIELDRVRIRLELLSEWLQMSGVDIDGALVPDSKHQDHSLEVTYDFPDPVTASVEDQLLTFQVAANFTLHHIGGLEIDEYGSIELESSGEPYLLSTFPTDLKRLSRFIAFGLREPVRPVEIVAQPKSKEDNSRTIEILSQYGPYRHAPEHIHPEETNFLYPDLEEQGDEKPTDVLQEWWETYDELEIVYDLYFHTLYHELPPEARFLTLSAALEAYYQTAIAEQGQHPVANEIRERIKTKEFALSPAIETLIREVVPPFNYQLESIINKHADLFSRLSADFDVVVEGMLEPVDSFTGRKTNTLKHTNALEAILEGALLSEIGIETDLVVATIDARYKQF